MAVYLPSAKIAVEIVDDPASLPADLDAFPDFTIVPITRADLRNPVAFDRVVRRIARIADRTAPAEHSQDARYRKRLRTLITTGLELNPVYPPQHRSA